jgi:hypothetical protein
MKLAIVSFAFYFVALGLTAKAELSGADLYRLCALDNKRADAACKMWITAFGGALFYAQTITNREKGSTALTCMPDGVSGIQFKLIIEKFLRDNPSIINMDAVSLAGAALIGAFPCKNRIRTNPREQPAKYFEKDYRQGSGLSAKNQR